LGVFCHELTVGAAKGVAGDSNDALGMLIGPASSLPAAANTATVQVVWNFIGFLAPVSNPPTVNSVFAGGLEFIRFRLGGYQGADPAAGVPTIQRYNCTTKAPIGTPTPGTFIGPAPLFIPIVNNYVYKWRPLPAWRGTCGTFTLTLDDSTVHTAEFRFK
jgi:hypothetical protein